MNYRIFLISLTVFFLFYSCVTYKGLEKEEVKNAFILNSSPTFQGYFYDGSDSEFHYFVSKWDWSADRYFKISESDLLVSKDLQFKKGEKQIKIDFTGQKLFAVIENHKLYVSSDYKKNDPLSNASKTNKEADSVELTSLIRKIYTWHETERFTPDFNYLVKDSLLKGMDWAKNNERLEELKKTDFFDEAFLVNLKDIAQQIDKYCKDEKEKYPFNLYPPWEDGVNDWCNCQGDPGGKWWGTITVANLRSSVDSADFNWTWGYEFYYHVTAKSLLARGFHYISIE